jgi:hypothetical protein
MHKFHPPPAASANDDAMTSWECPGWARQAFDLLGGIGDSPPLELNTDLGYCDESLVISCEFRKQIKPSQIR